MITNVAEAENYNKVKHHANSALVFASLLNALRPLQWIKNLVCLAGLIFSGRLFLVEMQLRAILAFAAFSAAASATYLLNDYFDRHRDLLNPRTSNRPFASGQLSIRLLAVTIFLLVTLSIMATFLLGKLCFFVLLCYLILNIAYSIRLKETVILDVMCIALGFVLRMLFGVFAVDVLPTPWIVICIFFLALFLGFGKRMMELMALGIDAVKARPVLAKYTMNYLNLAFGLTATLTVMTYTMYALAPHHDATMAFTVFPVFYCVLRYAHQVLVEGRGQSPERLLYADKMLWLGIFLWVILSVFALYCRPNSISKFINI